MLGCKHPMHACMHHHSHSHSFTNTCFWLCLQLLTEVSGTNAYCKYDDHILALFTSSLFLAAAFAALCGMYTCRKFGRKFTMCLGGTCFLVGTVLVTAAFSTAQLVVGRVVLGVGVGFANQVGWVGREHVYVLCDGELCPNFMKVCLQAASMSSFCFKLS